VPVGGVMAKGVNKLKTACIPSDLGSNEVAEKTLSVVGRSVEGKKQRRILVQVPIDYYYHMSRGGITKPQWEAGNKIYSLYERAAFRSSGTANLSGVFVQRAGGDKNRSESQYIAYEAFYEALDALGKGSVAREIILKVCCEGFFLVDLKVPYYKSSNQLMPRLCEALDILVGHFGIKI